ncbi:MAG TPA: GGDEF domain-containing protein [Chondromyces sp.]|nr:GGDEF domain-containing protein [Chondromyces sp.]
MTTYIGEICEDVPCIEPHTKSLEVHRIFKSNPKLQGIVVKVGDQPVALVMRILFYQKIGGLYGYNLYMGRPIDLLMNKSPLIVDSTQPIVDVSRQAMERPEEELYDYVIVTKEKKYQGVVSIQNLLLTFANIQKETARFTNPLTGLPGNRLIDKELTKLLKWTNFSVLYIDLDQFKAFNDTYGFKHGDELILATAEILIGNLQNHFVGHIGGDDFIVLLNNYNYEKACKRIIEDFDQVIKYFYSEEHWQQKYVVAESRFGHKEKIPLVSISIAVITNQEKSFKTAQDIVNEAMNIKKACKKNHFSCFITNHCDCIVN